MICEGAIIDNIVGLDWKIEPRDPKKRDEEKENIKYYTRLFETGGDTGMDYVDTIEWLLQDYFRIPFGGASELGREGDDPSGVVDEEHPLARSCYAFQEIDDAVVMRGEDDVARSDVRHRGHP